MNTCQTCQFWVRAKNTVTAGMGECRMWPPPQSLGWPRTRDIDWCAQHTVQSAPREQPVSFATGAAGTGQPAPAEGAGGHGAAAAGPTPRSTAPQTGAATPARPARAPRATKPEGVGRPAPL